MTGRVALLALAALACGAPPPARAAAAPPTAPPTAPDDETGALARLSRASPGDRVDLAEVASASRREHAPAPAARGRYADYRFSFDDGAPLAPSAVPAPYLDYEPVREVADAGAIEGVVTGSPPVADRRCPSSGPGAVVMLDGVRRGRSTGPLGGVLVREACGWRPELQLVAPIGGLMRVLNQRPRALTAEARIAGQILFAIELPEHGQQHVATMDRPGLVELVDDDAARAWIVVPPHPYATLTEPSGRFRLDAIPAGRYTLVVVSPPAAGDSAPLVQRVPVRVRRGQVTRVDIALDAR